jgi:hypothetical protein
VAALALTYRLHDVGMLSDWHYRQTCIELGKRGYKKGEPDGIARETSQLLAKVFKALRTKGITRTDIAKALHIDTKELNGYVFGIAMTAIDGMAQRSPGEAKPFLEIRHQLNPRRLQVRAMGARLI